ncbi:helix-turn-helix transcriptional regulator [Rhodovarius crocodyli]|uniref:Helix-turn-helix transcriptional regulator n=1 Tax=Rhodovarius crocodyli TaxID=1979269 RepID=A0A437MN49_9PROT|nr:LexA family transcriptional regulator [Rhodovarius crocodyli]RVT99074.1 helix-turn-helix transcriptional regulator [Rhodovarius crocodyli]
MVETELLKRIDARLKELKLSDRKASLKAEAGVDFVRDIRRRGHSPNAAKLARLARVLGVTPAFLLEANEAAVPQPMLQPRFAMRQIQVKGEVQAGIWREALEWPTSEWSGITVPMDNDFPGVEKFGLLVRGESMNKLYPDGTIVVVVRFADIGRPPHPGERVVVLRRQPGGSAFEATLKEYERDTRGRHLLWPRSTEPEFQTPFILEASPVNVGNGDEQLPGEIKAGVSMSDGEDLVILALVTDSIRREPRIGRR